MDIRKEWLAIRDKVAHLHPAMELSLKLLEESLSKASSGAKECDARGIGFALEAAKQSVALRKDAEHLRAAGVLEEETYSKFTDEMARYRDSHFEELINKFSTCMCGK